MKKILLAAALVSALAGCAGTYTVRGYVPSPTVTTYYDEPNYVYYGPTYYGPPGLVFFGDGHRGRGYYQYRRADRR